MLFPTPGCQARVGQINTSSSVLVVHSKIWKKYSFKSLEDVLKEALMFHKWFTAWILIESILLLQSWSCWIFSSVPGLIVGSLDLWLLDKKIWTDPTLFGIFHRAANRPCWPGPQASPRRSRKGRTCLKLVFRQVLNIQSKVLIN